MLGGLGGRVNTLLRWLDYTTGSWEAEDWIKFEAGFTSVAGSLVGLEMEEYIFGGRWGVAFRAECSIEVVSVVVQKRVGQTQLTRHISAFWSQLYNGLVRDLICLWVFCKIRYKNVRVRCCPKRRRRPWRFHMWPNSVGGCSASFFYVDWCLAYRIQHSTAWCTMCLTNPSITDRLLVLSMELSKIYRLLLSNRNCHSLPCVLT